MATREEFFASLTWHERKSEEKVDLSRPIALRFSDDSIQVWADANLSGGTCDCCPVQDPASRASRYACGGWAPELQPVAYAYLWEP